VIVSIILILVYLSVQFSQQNSQRSIEILGSSLYSITYIGSVASLMLNYLRRNVTDWRIYYPYFTSSLNELMLLENNFTSYDSSWSYCEASSILFSKSIPVYQDAVTTKAVLMSLLDYIQLTISHVIYI
jgi:uncharacterized membrane protein YoaT (DUF817 family)